MAYLKIRDKVTGAVIMDENSFISRHLTTITIPQTDTAQHTIHVPGLATGRPYYLFQANDNIHEAPIIDTNTNIAGYGLAINVSISGEYVTYQLYYTGGTHLTVFYLDRVRNWPAYLHLGVY